jgi:hypothetical protein
MQGSTRSEEGIIAIATETIDDFVMRMLRKQPRKRCIHASCTVDQDSDLQEALWSSTVWREESKGTRQSYTLLAYENYEYHVNVHANLQTSTATQHLCQIHHKSFTNTTEIKLVTYLMLRVVVRNSVMSEFMCEREEPRDHGFLCLAQHDCLVVPCQVITPAKALGLDVWGKRYGLTRSGR